MNNNVKLNKFSTEELLTELYLRGKEVEADLMLINPTLSKYGINLRPAPVHHLPTWEKVVVTKFIPQTPRPKQVLKKGGQMADKEKLFEILNGLDFVNHPISKKEVRNRAKLIFDDLYEYLEVAKRNK